MANIANFELRMTGPNKKLAELLNLFSAAMDDDGLLLPSKIVPVDPGETPWWIRLHGPGEWEGDTTAHISGHGYYMPPGGMVRELSLQYPAVLFEVDYSSEAGDSGIFEYSNGVLREIENLENLFHDEEYACYILDGECLDPPEIMDGDYLRWRNIGPQEQEQEEELLQAIPVLNAKDATVETAVTSKSLQDTFGWSQPKVSRVLTRLQREHTVSSQWSGKVLYWREKLLQHC